MNDSRFQSRKDVPTSQADLVRYLQVRDEAQRSKIARLLHHDVSGMLAAARMDLSRISSRAEGELREQLGRVDQILDQVIRDARKEMQRLHPALLDHFGLAMAIRHYVDESCRDSGMQYNLELPESSEGIEPEVAIAVYRLLETLIASDADIKELRVALQARRDGYVLRIERAGDGSRPLADLAQSLDLRAQKLWLESCGVAWTGSHDADRSGIELRIPRVSAAEPVEAPGG